MQPETPNNKQPGAIKAWFQRAWRALRNRPVQKLAAVLIAFVFWAIVIASDSSRYIEKTVTTSNVSISGQEILRSRELIVMDDLTIEPITVRMRVEVRQGDYDSVTGDTFSPRLVLDSQISEPGDDQEVFFTTLPTTLGRVLSIEPASVRVDVEEYRSKRIPVVVEQRGESGEPLWVSNISVDPESVSVSGPLSIVSQIQRAVVILPVNSLSASRPQDRVSAQLALQDASGNTVATSSLLRVTGDSVSIVSVNSALISMNVYPMRSIPVDTDSAVTGIVKHGYRVDAIRVVPETVNVAAEQDILNDIEALYVAAPLDITDQSESFTANVSLRSVSGVVHMESNAVTVEVDIVPAEHVHAYNNLPVSIIGQAANMAARVSPTEMDVIIRGDYDAVQGLAGADITLYVDVSGLTPGVHQLPVQCLVNGTDQFTFEPEYERVTVTIADPVDSNG